LTGPARGDSVLYSRTHRRQPKSRCGKHLCNDPDWPGGDRGARAPRGSRLAETRVSDPRIFLGFNFKLL